MQEGTQIPVWVYSNCEVVELFQDGTSLGKVNRGPMNKRQWNQVQFDWMVPWHAGTLMAVGYNADGTQELVRETIKTAGAPAKLSVTSTSQGYLPVDFTHVEQITVKTTDANGNFYPYGENRAYYRVDGPAYLRALDNGSPVDVQKHFGVNNRNAFMGLNKVFLQATKDSGDVLFTAASILGEKRQLTSNLVSIDVQQVAMRGNPTKPVITIYYTTDGSEPTKQSTQYTQPFAVALETTVRAAVFANGEKILDMQEKFGAEEGLHWNRGQSLTYAPQPVYAHEAAIVPYTAVQRSDVQQNHTPESQQVRGIFASNHSTVEQKFQAWRPYRESYIQSVIQNIVNVVNCVGGREPGSKYERGAQRMVLSQLTNYTDEAHREMFEVSPRALMVGFLVSILLMIGAGLLYVFDFRWWSLILTLAAFDVLSLECVMYKEFLDPLLPKRISENVIGTIRPRGELKRRAIFSGHCDSGYELRFNYICGGHLFTTVLSTGLVGMIVFLVLQLVFWNEYKQWIATFQLIYIPLYALLLFFTNTSVISPGANSNLTGVFCAMAVAKFLKENGIELENTEVQIVITGSQQCGLRGAKDYVKKHIDEIPTAFFCFDTLRDLSDMAIYSRDLTGIVQNDLRVCDVMRRAGQLAGLDLEYRTMLLGATDAAAIRLGGMPAATFTAMDPAPASYWRTRRDNADNLEPRAIGYGLDIAIGSLIIFDQEGFATE